MSEATTQICYCSQNSHRQYINEQAHLRSNRILFTKIGSGLGAAHGLANPCFRVLSLYLSFKWNCPHPILTQSSQSRLVPRVTAGSRPSPHTTSLGPSGQNPGSTCGAFTSVLTILSFKNKAVEPKELLHLEIRFSSKFCIFYFGISNTQGGELEQVPQVTHC